MKKVDFSITGMHCASCANAIEKSLSKVKGVRKANVNFASEKASVEYDPKLADEIALKNAVKAAGYKVIEGHKKSGNAAELKLKIIVGYY